jgi:predicted dehydrogenase
MSDPMRIAVVGAGGIAQVAHLPVLRKLPGVEIAAICDNDLSKAQALAARFDVKDTYDDIEEVLQYAKPDAIVICTPNHLHEIHIMAALSAGAHVLCERPIALRAEGVEAVLAAAERYGKRVMAGMNHRFRSDVQAVRGFLAGGELGSVDAIRGGWYTFQPSRQHLGWRLHRQEAGGGALLDLGLPLIDLGLWLAGWPIPKRVSAHRRRGGGHGIGVYRLRERHLDLRGRELASHGRRGAVLVRRRRQEGRGLDRAAQGVQGRPRHADGRDADGGERAGDPVRAVLPRRMDVFPGGAEGGRQRPPAEGSDRPAAGDGRALSLR